MSRIAKRVACDKYQSITYRRWQPPIGGVFIYHSIDNCIVYRAPIGIRKGYHITLLHLFQRSQMLSITMAQYHAHTSLARRALSGIQPGDFSNVASPTLSAMGMSCPWIVSVPRRLVTTELLAF